jgi:uncharacterized protein YndB with AHSA1/START domain
MRIPFVDKYGNAIPGMPVASSVVTFEKVNGSTKMISITEYATDEEQQQILKIGAIDGITETMDRLDAYLAKGQT